LESALGEKWPSATYCPSTHGLLDWSSLWRSRHTVSTFRQLLCYVVAATGPQLLTTQLQLPSFEKFGKKRDRVPQFVLRRITKTTRSPTSNRRNQWPKES